MSGLWFESPTFEAITLRSWSALFYLGLVASVGGFIVYFMLLKRLSPIILSFVFIFTEMAGQAVGMGVGLAVSVPLAVGISALELIVILVQAYVFTLLTAVFIGMAIHVHH